MKILLLILLVSNPLCAFAQGVVYVPSPPYPGQYPPFNQYGVMIGPSPSEAPEYAITINGTPAYTLSVVYAQNAGISGVLQFDIIPSGSNSVMTYVDSSGRADVVNFEAGATIGPGLTIPSAIWADASYTPLLNYYVNLDTLSQAQFTFGDFVADTGFVGLQFWEDGQEYYGFLQMDTRFSPLYGGMYQGYAYNTTPGGDITTSYFRDTLQVPEPSTWALLVLGSLTIFRSARNCFASSKKS